MYLVTRMRGMCITYWNKQPCKFPQELTIKSWLTPKHWYTPFFTFLCFLFFFSVCDGKDVESQKSRFEPANSFGSTCLLMKIHNRYLKISFALKRLLNYVKKEGEVIGIFVIEGSGNQKKSKKWMIPKVDKVLPTFDNLYLFKIFTALQGEKSDVRKILKRQKQAYF